MQLSAASVEPPVASVIDFPVRRESPERLRHDAVLALAAAGDLASGIAEVVEVLRTWSCAARVEWWATDDDGVHELVAASGTARGFRRTLPIGRSGVVVIHDARIVGLVETVVESLAPVVRRRAAEERLERMAVLLARRNQALEDFAALVAHELKAPLEAALIAPDPSSAVEDALQLVSELLEAAQGESVGGERASVDETLELVVGDLEANVEITADVGATLPLSREALRVILRNLLANAVAAGAGRIHVSAEPTQSAYRLVVDDDGAGLDSADSYAKGAGLGLTLCRRVANRFGGTLALTPRSRGGTRATLAFAEALE